MIKKTLTPAWLLLMIVSCCSTYDPNEQLDSIIIPWVAFEYDNVSLFLEQLETASKKYDKNNKGVHFILDLDEKAKNKPLRADITLEKVPLRILLTVVCKIENFRYYIKGDSIIIEERLGQAEDSYREQNQ